MLLSFLTFLSFPFLIDSCLETPTKCPCPTVRYIDQIGIANLEYGSYLANRTTTRPRVTVTDECQILADVSELDTQNHFLMVFREGAPPIFVRFELKMKNNLKLRLNVCQMTLIRSSSYQISHVKVEEEYRWQYYNGTVNDLSVAVQSNEEWCSCNFTFVIQGSVNLTTLTCDKFSTVVREIPNNTLRASLKAYPERTPTVLSVSPTDSLVVDDLMCVNGQWYYNNFAVPLSTYFTPDSNRRSFYCGCSDMELIIAKYTLDPKGAYANYTMRDPISSYSEETCLAEVKCSNPNDTLVIYSLNYKTLSYPPGTKPSMSCASSPLSSSSDSPKFWYIDGVMVNDPRTACYSNTCPCPFAILDPTYYEYYIGTHPALGNMTSLYSMTLENPNFPMPDSMFTDNACPDVLEFVSHGIIIFDKTTAAVFNKSTLAATCSSATKKWTVEGQEFEQLYAIGYYNRD